MLQLILAASGGGKTTHIMNLIKNYSEGESEKITLLVPEQYSFTCQKNVLMLIGEEKMKNVDVLSFTELGEKLIGRPAFHERCRLSDSAAAVMMSMTLNEVRDKLLLYGRHADKRSTVNEFLSLSSEFKQNAVSVDNLRTLAQELDEGLLKTKLNDISTVLEAFDGKVSESYFNPDDLLTELNGTAELDTYFNDRLVFIDSFRGFTAPEYEIIRKILIRAKSVYVTLCTRDLGNTDDITDLFAKTKNTAARLYDIAQKSEVRIQKPQFLSGNGKYNNFPPHFERYSCGELRFLEKELFSDENNLYEDSCDNITLCKASDIYCECKYVAARIKKLVRDEGLRYRDIAVIARDMTSYEAPLRSALKKCGINIYEDYRRPADASPVINIISAALSAVSKNYDSDSLMRYLKTGLTGLTDEAVSAVENYCYIWQINGKKWLEDWTANPEGYGTDSNPENTKLQLDYLNKNRVKIIAPLAEFRKAVKGGVRGEEAMKALWHFIENINLPENVTHLADKLASDGEAGIRQELQRMWDFLINLLNELEGLVRGKTVTAEKLSSYLELMLSVQTVGSIPAGLDEVIIGAADRMRISSPKVAFIIGANEGVFPPEVSVSSTLTLRERAVLKTHGVELSECGEWKLADEKLIAYSAVCCPRDKLFVTCSCSSAGGDELMPCEFYNRIKQLFTNIREEDASTLDEMFYVEGKQTAFEEYAKSPDGVFRETMTDYFSRDEEFSGRIASLQRAAGGRDFKIIDKNITELLFGRELFMTPSRIEKYYKCAFSYFCNYGLKAKAVKAAELDSLQIGNVNHYVMENLLGRYGKEELNKMSDGELQKIINALAEEYLPLLLGGSEPDERFIYLYEKLKVSLFSVAKRLIEEFNHCDFIPVDFELDIGGDEGIEKYIPDGSDGSVGIVGRVDRVDIAEKNGVRYLRVIDYKSKQKEFRLCDVVNGINMQMLIYLFALWKNGGKKYGDVIPAGVLYYNASSPIVSAGPDSTSEAVEKELAKKGCMTGIILENEDIINMMEHDGNGKFIPASIDPKNGSIKGETINFTALEKLKEKSDALIMQMAEHLRNGDFSAVPCTDSKAEGQYVYTNCNYCDFKAVCGFEEGIPVKRYSYLKTSDVIAALEEGDEDNGNSVE